MFAKLKWTWWSWSGLSKVEAGFLKSNWIWRKLKRVCGTQNVCVKFCPLVAGKVLINNVVFKILNNSFHFGNHLLFRTRPCWIWYTLCSLRLSIRVQLSNNPYAFMQYPYTMPAAPFYGYFQTPMRAAVPNPPCTSSQNGQASSSSASQNWNWTS